MSATAATLPNLDVLLDVGVKLTVELGNCQMLMRDVLQLAAGSVVQLDKASDAPVDLYVSGKLFARGEVVVVEGRIGIRITELVGAKA
ncbi:MAG TPA: flagellar motor switch protein FliN [Verrucomicrobiae bacterium]|nr:flagellar motor switch protein FliN [Verrucomicrobiae bacterium]